MAAGDITVTIGIEGGDSKTGTIPKATADLAIAWIKASSTTGETPITTDAQCMAYEVNKVLAGITNRANKQQNQAAIPTAKTYTEVS